jgi:hypothetical protein
MSTWLITLTQKNPENLAGLLRLWDYFICSGHRQGPAFASAVLIRDVLDQACKREHTEMDVETYLLEEMAQLGSSLKLTTQKAQNIVLAAEKLRQQHLASQYLRDSFNTCIGVDENCPLYLNPVDLQNCISLLPQPLSFKSKQLLRSVTRASSDIIGTYQQQIIVGLFYLLIFWIISGIPNVLKFFQRNDPEYIID